MSEPTSPDDLAVGEPERLHPLFVLTGLGQSLRGIAGGYVGLGYLAATGNWWWAIFGTVALLAITAVGILIYWMKFAYRVGANEIRIDSGVFSRTNRSIPFDRIQDVDITQGPIARALGVAQVKFETGGGGGKEEGVLHAIALERAQDIREVIRARRSGAALTAQPEQAEERPTVFAMDLKRVLLAGLFNFSLAVLAGLLGVTQTFGDVLGFDPLDESFWRNLLAASAPVQEFVLANRIVAVVAGMTLLILIGAATGIFRTLLREYRFRLNRTEAGLRRRRGLVTLTDVTIPVRRAQAAIVASGPVRDPFGWRELRLQSLAGDVAGSGDHVVAPLARDDEVNSILAELGWRAVPREVAWRRVSKAYIWMRLIALGPLLLIVGFNLFLFASSSLWVDESIRAEIAAAILPGLVPIIVVFVLLLGAVVTRWLDWRRTGYVLDNDRLLVRRGWWKRRLLVLPTAKIQSLDLRESAFSRLFGTATLQFGVAGGTILATPTIPALPRESASELREQLLSKLL
jgi:putative membrane protein